MEIHFVRGNAPSYLPELAAYRKYLASRGHSAQVHERDENVPSNAQVVWWICGRVPLRAAARLRAAFHVHEYASASVPPAAWLKDRIKHWTQPRPHHRVFQNDWVRDQLGFGSEVPFSLRDMGVPRAFLDAQCEGSPAFDLVYLGEMSRLSAFESALRELQTAGLKLLLVGSIDASVRRLRSDMPNVHCVGQVPQEQVPLQLLRARAGLNLMPERLPFTHQTSTKVLEYLAVGLPVVSNDYHWVHSIARHHQSRVRTLKVLDATAWCEAMRDLPVHQHDRSRLVSLTWEARLAGLPVWQAIEQWGGRS
jgi:glycosyltransferase involved in cell wall biosynthesis